MECLKEIIDNEFSVEIISRLNLKYDGMYKAVSDHMDAEVFEGVEEELISQFVDASKDFFVQGFFRGMAAAKSGTL
ncbi:hypothetical protein AALA98_16455 [Lachnospiraceae bacterium 45-W7]